MIYTKNIFIKKVKIEEYIPLMIRSKEQVGIADYVIYKNQNSLLEIVFDKENQNVYRICMPICGQVEKVNENFSIPKEIVKGDLLVDKSEEIITESFKCYLFNDAIKIKVSEKKGSQFISSDNVLYELDNEELVSITLYSQTKKIVEHTYKELCGNAI
jgi:hypothetical protein